MTNTPLISIALATYNGEKYLAEQLDSILAQDYPNIEIVISDDCSTDHSWAILQSYERDDPRIRLLPRDTNLGYVRNFVRAFNACRGDLISPCDQDDIWHFSKTRRLAEAMGDASLIYCDSRFIDEEGRFLGQNLSDTVDMISGSDSRNLLFCTSICGHAMLFRKSLLTLTDRIEAVPYVDWAIAFLALENGHVSYLDEALVDWRHHDESISSHVRRKSQASRRRTLETDERTLEALSFISTKNKSFAVDACKKWKKWHTSYFDLSMFSFIVRYGHVTHLAHSARVPALKYLFGYKLKKLLRPDYY